MQFETMELNGLPVSKLTTTGQLINTVDDALELMANAGTDRIIVTKDHLHPDFFKLGTRLAGEILQKFSNYGVYLAVVGDYAGLSSKSLRDFIYESNQVGRILFVESEAEIGRYWG